MAPAATALAEALANLQIRSPLIPVLSNVTGKAHGSPEDIRAALVKQVTAPVRWHTCVTEARDVHACEHLLEVGPGEVLSGLARRLKPPLLATYVTRTPACAPPASRASAAPWPTPRK